MNTTFTKEIVPYLVNGFIGDYVNFHQTLENGPHSGVHLIFGGDMGVRCPFGLGPPQCYVGPKWAPNGERGYGLMSFHKLTLIPPLAQILYSTFIMRYVALP